MTQPATTGKEARDPLLAHLRSWHGVVPPYQPTLSDAHGLLHHNGDEACDRDHALGNLREGRS